MAQKPPLLVPQVLLPLLAYAKFQHGSIASDSSPFVFMAQHQSYGASLNAIVRTPWLSDALRINYVTGSTSGADSASTTKGWNSVDIVSGHGSSKGATMAQKPPLVVPQVCNNIPLGGTPRWLILLLVTYACGGRMAGSSRAVTTADAGHGFSYTSLPKDYPLILPPLPTGEGLRRTLVLHRDIAARPYGINDFRKPLKELGIIQEVSGIGAYQMSHVWLLNMKTDEAKKTLLDAGLLSVKDRPCVVVDPERQEVRLKLHWVAFDINAETVRHAFWEYCEVKEVISDKWRDEDFERAESTTRFVRLLLKEGVTTDRIPHQMRLGSGMALVVVPGRAPLCLRCRNTGHIRRDCRVPRCTGCRAFGHEQADCTRSYASAASRATNADHSELLMDEEEAERAAASKQWRVAGSKKSRGAGRLRSSSLSRGGDGTTP
ncbi:uncharacterized protein LOC142774347 [Rhipicephalus microplus]|uniref:uncharacterized protein LOC142774347 n=1 Tax=Rhipicephalus microplus TaxID=6941 RepID=UPI003F6D2DDC